MSDAADNKIENMQPAESSPENNEAQNSEYIGKGSLFYRIVKRCFDFVASLIAGLLVLPFIVIFCVIIMCMDPGKPIFVQKRVGKHGKPLNIVKLRSMKKDADKIESSLSPEQLAEYKREYKLDDDTRLIGYKKSGDSNKCFGGLLRRFSFDELPQIICNILILGNMSLVGPRPILESELTANYTPEEQKLLLSVKPGLTGYWQAYARNNATYETGERQSMELYYARNRSFWLDIKILFATVGAVIKTQGAK